MGLTDFLTTRQLGTMKEKASASCMHLLRSSLSDSRRRFIFAELLEDAWELTIAHSQPECGQVSGGGGNLVLFMVRGRAIFRGTFLKP